VVVLKNKPENLTRINGRSEAFGCHILKLVPKQIVSIAKFANVIRGYSHFPNKHLNILRKSCRAPKLIWGRQLTCRLLSKNPVLECFGGFDNRLVSKVIVVRGSSR
jgi:hypothetical protein